MAEKKAGIRVDVKSGDKSGLADIEKEAEKRAKGVKKAFSDALSDGLKGGKEAVKGMLSDLKSAVGTVTGLMGGLGTAELVKGGLEANSKFRDLRWGIQAATGSARDFAAVQKQLQKTSIDTAQDSMLMVDVFEGLRGETGSLEFARDTIDDVAVAARGAHKPLEQMGNIAGILNEKFGVEAGEDMKGALADVVGLSQKGGIGFEDMAQKLGLIGAYAKEAGLEGRQGFSTMVALLNMADNANGNFKKGLTGVGALLEQLGSGAGKNKLAAALGISGGALKGDAMSQIEAIMKATKGQKGQLEKAFGGETLKLLVDMGKTYSAAFDETKGSVKDKSAAATAALRAALLDAGKSAVTWSAIQNEAAASMKEAPQQVAVATEKLRQAFQSEKFQNALSRVIERLPALAEFLADVAGWAVDNPGSAIVAAITASIGKAAIGETVGSLLGSALKSLPTSSLAAAGAIGLLAAAALAAADAIKEFEEKSAKEEKKLDETPKLIEKAQKEMAMTGAVSQDTLDELAQRRASFEAVSKATETGGQERLSYASMLAAKVMGGTDELAVGEGITNEANKLGASGVQTTIADLDAIIAQAVAAKRAGGALAGKYGTGGAPGAVVPGAPGVVPAASGGGGGGGAPAVDPSTVAQAVANGVGAKELRVRVTNPKDIGGGGPTGAGPTTPGYRPR